MFLRNKTKILISTLDLSNSATLAFTGVGNTHLVSALNDFSANAEVQPILYGDSYMSIGDIVNRGVHSSPGAISGYSISLITNICIGDNVTNNMTLWDLLLTGKFSTESAIHTGYIDNRTNYSELQQFSIILVNEEYCKVYTGCVISGFNLSMEMSSLLSGSWNILSNNSYVTSVDNISHLMSGSVLTYVSKDVNLEYIVDKPTVVTLDALNIPALQVELMLNHNVSTVPDNTINSVGSITGYQLGSFGIDGAITTYTRVGTIGALLDTLTDNYKTNSEASVLPLSFLFKGLTADLRLTIGEVFIPMPRENISQVYSTTLVFTANNYLDNGLILEKI